MKHTSRRSERSRTMISRKQRWSWYPTDRTQRVRHSVLKSSKVNNWLHKKIYWQWKISKFPNYKQCIRHMLYLELFSSFKNTFLKSQHNHSGSLKTLKCEDLLRTKRHCNKILAYVKLFDCCLKSWSQLPFTVHEELPAIGWCRFKMSSLQSSCISYCDRVTIPNIVQ